MDEDLTLELRATGPVTEGGRMPLSEIARLAGELQATIERIALNLSGGRTIGGRRPQDVVDAVRLELYGFSPGSARLAIRRPKAALGDHDLLVESMDALEYGAKQIQRQTHTLPPGFTSQVVDGLIRLSGGIADGFMTQVELTRNGKPILTVDNEFRILVRKLRQSTRRDEATVVGLLQMGDFAPSSLRCRVDTLSASIVCTFDESMKDMVLAAMDRMVSVRGVAEFAVDGVTMRSLDIEEIDVLDAAEDVSLESLTRSQGVAPLTDIALLATSEPMTDEEFDTFLTDALSARRQLGE